MVNVTTPLLIVGAALPRTGTTSLVVALEKLGYRVWHATTWSPAMAPIWNEIVAADGDTERYKKAMDRFVEQLSAEGLNATLDQPSCFVYQQLLEYYPDAKVLNTQRDKASWARSMVEMSYSLDLLVSQPPYSLRMKPGESPFGIWAKRKLGIPDEEIFKTGVPSENPFEQKSSVSLATCEAAYDRYQEKVKATVSPENLVAISVKDGWGPLCEHFIGKGCVCPEEPFPHLNSREGGFLLDWRLQMEIEIELYRIYPLLAQRWLAMTLFYAMRNKLAIAAAIVAILSTALYMKR